MEFRSSMGSRGQGVMELRCSGVQEKGSGDKGQELGGRREGVYEFNEVNRVCVVDGVNGVSGVNGVDGANGANGMGCNGA